MKVVDEDFKIKLHFSETGLLSLGSILEKYNYQVKLVDLGWLVTHGRLELNNSYHSEAARLIVNQNIPVLGFNTRCDTYPSVINIAKKCKQLNPDSMIIFGGHQATFTDIETLNTFPFVDIVVRGEGELTLLDLMNHLKEKKNLQDVTGITYRDNGKILKNKEREPLRDLDSLPLPAYHLVQEYIEQDEKNLSRDSRAHILTGRGCPYNCNFCICSLMEKRIFRMKSPEKIIEEILFLKKEYGISKFEFTHDNFTADREIVEKICYSLQENKIGDIKWSCSSRLDTLDASLIKLMSESGCEGIFIGIESGSRRMQTSIGKRIDLTLLPKILKECGKYGIHQVTSFIIGFPDEKLEDLDATLELALKCCSYQRNSIEFHLLVFMPGTALFKKYKNRLKYVSLCSDMVSGVMPKLNENLSLIRKYPHIFSTFYSVKPKYLPLLLPYEIASGFLDFLFIYPRSYYISIAELGIKPRRLLLEFKKWVKLKNKIQQRQFVLSKPIIYKYFPSFLKFIYKRRKKSFDFVGSILKFERQRVEIFFDAKRKCW